MAETQQKTTWQRIGGWIKRMLSSLIGVGIGTGAILAAGLAVYFRPSDAAKLSSLYLGIGVILIGFHDVYQNVILVWKKHKEESLSLRARLEGTRMVYNQCGLIATRLIVKNPSSRANWIDNARFILTTEAKEWENDIVFQGQHVWSSPHSFSARTPQAWNLQVSFQNKDDVEDEKEARLVFQAEDRKGRLVEEMSEPFALVSPEIKEQREEDKRQERGDGSEDKPPGGWGRGNRKTERIVLWGGEPTPEAAYQWLRENSRDEPGERWRKTAEIAEGINCTEAEAEKVCSRHDNIYRHSESRETRWCAWGPYDPDKDDQDPWVWGA